MHYSSHGCFYLTHSVYIGYISLIYINDVYRANAGKYYSNCQNVVLRPRACVSSNAMTDHPRSAIAIEF